ncbi:MAG: hypothetical protein ABSC50_07530 [Candidatus Bathyarchaeia archaeon]
MGECRSFILPSVRYIPLIDLEDEPLVKREGILPGSFMLEGEEPLTSEREFHKSKSV